MRRYQSGTPSGVAAGVMCQAGVESDGAGFRDYAGWIDGQDDLMDLAPAAI